MSKCPAWLVPLKREVNFLFFRRYRYRRVVRRHLLKYYTESRPLSGLDDPAMVVAMSDGRLLHGGLADRLRSIASFYHFGKEDGRRFAIHFTWPFPLGEYLVPAEYDWRLKEGDLTYNSLQAEPVYMDNTGDTGAREIEFEKATVAGFLQDRNRQYHVYSSFYWCEDSFADDFRELFKPSDRMQALVEKELERLGGERRFVSVSARFLDLLGDFREPKPGRQLDDDERESLITRCIDQLQSIHSQNPGTKVLVTSDSVTFLGRALQLDYVVSPEGTIAHVDTDVCSDHTKTFLDFLLIGKGYHAWQLRIGPMYGGNFSLRAAQAGNVPFTRLRIP